MIRVKAGRVPGTVIDLSIGEVPLSVFDVLELTAKEIQRLQGRSAPPFMPKREEYKNTTTGKKMIDIPFLNGKPLATKVGDHWRNVEWDTPVKDGDIVLLIPKIQGNQIVVSVGRIPGATAEYSIDGGEDEAGGTVADALEIAGLEDGRVYVNGVPAEMDRVLGSGDTVLVYNGPYTKEELLMMDGESVIALVLDLQSQLA